jgi:hypothetical protein
MDTERIWRAKTDDEVLNAFQQLGDYMEEGQRVLKAEIERRQLTPLPTIPAPVVPPSKADENPIVRLWAGDYPLPVAYWMWGQVGSLAWAVAIALVGVATAGQDGAVSPWGLATRQVLALAFLGYLIIVGVGVWRSAGQYQGSPGWAALARVGVLAPVCTLVMRAIFVTFSAHIP